MLRCCVMTSRSPVRRVSAMGNAVEPENTSGGAEGTAGGAGAGGRAVVAAETIGVGGAAGVVAGVELLPQATVRQDTTSSTRKRDFMGASSANTR
jgi:hypothetical protein